MERLTLRRCCASEKSGKVADYILELSKASSDWFGIPLATIDGHVYEVKDGKGDGKKARKGDRHEVQVGARDSLPVG